MAERQEGTEQGPEKMLDTQLPQESHKSLDVDEEFIDKMASLSWPQESLDKQDLRDLLMPTHMKTEEISQRKSRRLLARVEEAHGKTQMIWSVEMSPSSEQYRRVTDLFHRELSRQRFVVTRVVMVYSPQLVYRYRQKKREMKNARNGEDITETLLFHGTDRCNVDSICFRGYLVPTHRNCLGYAICFAKDSGLASCFNDCTTDPSCYPHVMGPPQDPSDLQPAPAAASADPTGCPSGNILFQADNAPNPSGHSLDTCTSRSPSHLSSPPGLGQTLASHSHQINGLVSSYADQSSSTALSSSSLPSPPPPPEPQRVACSGCRHYMFLNKVLVGDSAPSTKDDRQPPSRDDDPTRRYDSCYGNDRFHVDQWAVFDSRQVYPLYVIEYEQRHAHLFVLMLMCFLLVVTEQTKLVILVPLLFILQEVADKEYWLRYKPSQVYEERNKRKS